MSDAKHYAFQVGGIECCALLDGTGHLGKDGILKRYRDASEDDYRQAFEDIGLSLDDADTSLNILLAKIEDEVVLVDAGQGREPHGKLVRSMEQAGMNPDEVTLVVITHTHGDHVLGLVTDDGAPTFPNATYVISDKEMTFWQGRIDEGLDQGAIITMMKESGLRLIASDAQIMPGMTAFPIPGHTPGQIGVQLESGGEGLLHMADLLHSPIQFGHPEWSAYFDADTNVSVPTRRGALQRAADENMLTMFYHLAFPGLGWVKQAERGFIWEPLTM